MELKNSATGGTEPRDFILRWGALLLLRRRTKRAGELPSRVPFTLDLRGAAYIRK
jgi:hypothetical protein